MRGCGRPAARAAAPMLGTTWVATARRVRHPENGAVGDLASDAQQARRERGDQERNRDRRWRGRGAAVRVDVVAVEVDGLAAQERREHTDVLLGVTARRRVGVAIHALDDRRVRRPDSQREARPAERVGDGEGALRHLQWMHRIRLHDRGAELDRARRPTGECDGQQRIIRCRTCVPDRTEAVGFRVDCLRDHALERRAATTQSDSHPTSMTRRSSA